MADELTLAHNEEAKDVWDAYNAGHPARVPVAIGTSTRYFLFHEGVNPGARISFEAYSEDADIMLEFLLKAAAWRSTHVALYCDDQAGLPDLFHVTVDLQNYSEAAFFGAPVQYREGQVPDTTPILAGDHKNLLFDRGLPDRLTGGIFAHAHRLYAQMQERMTQGFTYLGRPVQLDPFGLGTEGPLTTATGLRGVDLYTDFYEDPQYVHRLLDFVTEGIIERIQAHRRFFELPAHFETWSLPDDSMQLISTELYREFLLPCHQRMKAALTTAERIGVHLCGDSTRHFKTMRDELGAYSFDTGFPVDFTWLRQELGPEVEIRGGPSIMILRHSSPQQVGAEAQRILASGIMGGGRFVLRDGNNLAPGTPLVNLEAMYQAARQWGCYR